MGDKSGIEWTDATWNPIVGCSVVSPGCTNCYAMKMAARLEAINRAGSMDDEGYRVRAAPGARTCDHYEGTTRKVNGHAVWTGKVALAPDAILIAPLRWRRPRRIFVNSMGDLFHESVPDDWIDKVFAVMALAPQHTFQVLTKRALRMREYMTHRGSVEQAEVQNRLAWDTTISVMDLWAPDWKSEKIDGPHRSRAIAAFTKWPLPNVWLGVSAEDQARADERIPDLLATPAAVRFVSAEPLLGPIDLTIDSLVCTACPHCLDASPEWDTGVVECRRCDSTGKGDEWGIDWIIAGGESGPHARPMHPDWARSLRDQCAAAGVPFFFKQHGEWIGVPDLRRLPGGSGRGCGAFDHCRYDHGAEAVLVGKRAAGRLLDDREHNDMPKAAT
jgi:protein gp37